MMKLIPSSVVSTVHKPNLKQPYLRMLYSYRISAAFFNCSFIKPLQTKYARCLIFTTNCQNEALWLEDEQHSDLIVVSKSCVCCLCFVAPINFLGKFGPPQVNQGFLRLLRVFQNLLGFLRESLDFLASSGFLGILLSLRYLGFFQLIKVPELFLVFMLIFSEIHINFL